MSLDLRNADAVIDALHAGAAANRSCALRHGCCERVDPADAATLIATGDLHDNPLHFQSLLAAAGMTLDGEPDRANAKHLTLHELIHPDTLTNGMDLSYRVLAKVALLKSRYPLRVHALLANHELAQIVGAGIVKDGVNVVKAFNAGVEFVFGDEADRVQEAIGDFIRSMPLATRFVGAGDGGADLLCAHSLPGPDLIDRFDPTVLVRALTDDDLQPRRGSAHIMVWGRAQTPELVERLAQSWGVGTFVLGHEKAEDGRMMLTARTVILNTDHARGVYCPINTAAPNSAASVFEACVPIAHQE